MTPLEFHNWLRTPTRRPLVMGVLNVTPDSFSDAGRFADVARAVEQAKAMAEAGADLIDIGGESTRPGSQRITADEQIHRITPVLSAWRELPDDLKRVGGRDGAGGPVLWSIDTTLAPVAEAALDLGAHLVNDVSGGRDDPRLLPMIARRRVPVVLMHMQGEPATMQHDPRYNDVSAEVGAFLRQRLGAAIAAGVPVDDVLLDPGVGFGKTIQHNLELLRRLGELTSIGRPLVLGTSRKGFIGRITGEAQPSGRLFGTAASVAWCIAQGAAIVRVHDVGPMVQVVRMIQAIRTGWREESS